MTFSTSISGTPAGGVVPPMVSRKVAVLSTSAPSPVIFTLYVPSAVLDVVAILRVAELPDCTEVGSKVAVAPLGRPVAENWTVWAEPLPITVFTVADAVSPGLTEPAVGDTDMVKSLPVEHRSLHRTGRRG